MKIWLELTEISSGRKVLVNMDHVERIGAGSGGGANLYFRGASEAFLTTSETYSDVHARLRCALGDTRNNGD